MTEDRSTEVLKLVKQHLHVDWNDDDEMLSHKIKRSERYINDLVGSTLAFDDDSYALELLMERVRYDWNNSLDDFEVNFKSELLAFIMQTALKGDADGTN